MPPPAGGAIATHFGPRKVYGSGLGPVRERHFPAVWERFGLMGTWL